MNTHAREMTILSMWCLLAGILLAGPALADELVLWNRLGSVDEASNSEIGLDGTVMGGSFGPGMFGGAYVADHNENRLLRFPKEVIPADRGCIEFWAKMMGFSGTVPWGQSPMFVYATDWAGTIYEVQFNGNNGGGQGGFCYAGGHNYDVGTGAYTQTYTYEALVGGDVEGWHHYALVWDEDGVEGYYSGTRKLVAFIDGELTLAESYGIREDGGFPSLVDGALWLVDIQANYGAVAVDNLKIWDYPALDAIEHRFDEDWVPEPSTLVMLALAGTGIIRRR